MASKEEVFARRKRILTELETSSKSIKEMAEILGVKERTIEADIKALREDGSDIEIKQSNIVLKHRGEAIRESDFMDVWAVGILMVLGESINGLTCSEIEDKFYCDICCGPNDRKKASTHSEELTKGDEAFHKRIQYVLAKLMKQKKIIQDNGRYIVAMDTSVQISLSDRNLDAIYRELVNNCDQNTFGDILYLITQKVYEAVDLKLYGEEIQKVDSIILQNEKSSYQKYEKAMKNLFAVDFKGKRIKIKSTNRYKKPIEDKVFSVGIIVFVVEDGSFYLIGKTNSDKENHYTPIKLSRVEAIEETEEKNEEYGKKEYEDICNEMYRFSVENPFPVTLKYKNGPANMKKVKRYSQNREKFSINVTKNSIICEDKVRGKDDYERFLRKEGNDAVVLKPNFLIEDMVKSAKRIIERYTNDK